MNHLSTIRQLIWFAIGFLLFTSGMACAQSDWQAASDSSNRYFKQGQYEQAYAWSLVMIRAAESLHARNDKDTTLVKSLVRASISQRLSSRPDTTRGLAHATQALNLLTPSIKQTLLGAQVYSLNAIFNYAVGQHKKALKYAEIAADRLETLGYTLSSPYWEVQRYRVLMYRAANDSVSLDKAVKVFRQTLPITAALFGRQDSRYTGLMRLWTSTLHHKAIQTMLRQAEVDSVWEATVEAVRQEKGAADLDETNLLYDAVRYYSSVGRNEKAVEFAGRMLAKAETMYAANASQDTTLIHSLYLMATYTHQVSHLHIQSALRYTDRAIALLKPIYESKPWAIELYALSGQLRWNAGDQSKARMHSQKVIELSVRLKQTENLAFVQAQMILASIYSVSRDKNGLVEARQILESIVPVVERVSGPKSKSMVMTLGLLGTVYMMSMPLDDATQRKADELWQTLIPLARSLGDQEQLCRMLTGMGEYYIARNQTNQARTALQESIAIGKTLSNQVFRLIALINLATVETATGHNTEAARIADEVLAQPEVQLLPQMMVMLLANAVDGNIQLGRLDRAEELARQAMKLAVEQYGTQHNYWYALSMGSLGMVYYQRSDVSKAIRYLEESLATLEGTARPDDPVLSRIRMITADVYAGIDNERALDQYKKARQSMERQQNYKQSTSYLAVLRSQMALLRTLGRLSESAQLADSTILAYSGVAFNDGNTFPLFLEDAYYTYRRMGRQADADSIRHRLEQAVVSDTLSAGTRSTILNLIGLDDKAKGNYREAIRRFSESIRIANTLHTNSATINAYVYVRLAMCYLGLGDRPEATRVLTESVDRLRQNVSQNLWYMSEEQREAYIQPYTLTEIYGIAFQKPIPDETELGLAYNYRLLMQGILLSTGQKVLREAANQSDTLLRQRVGQLFALRKTIAQYSFRPSVYVDVDSLKELSAKLEKQIGYFASTIRNQNRAYTWQDVQKSLKPDEAAVEIIRFNRWQFGHVAQETDTVQYAALIIRPGWSAPRLVVLPDGNELESVRIRQYRDAIEGATSNGTAYRQFWAPFASQLQGVRNAFVAADGVYHLLSLPTLYNADQKQYLIDELQLVMVGSTRELVNNPRPTGAVKGVLVGFPTYRPLPAIARADQKQHATKTKLPTRNRDGFAFDELPATEIEVNEIARLLTKAQIKTIVRTKAGASESFLKSVANPRILHIATHGFFKPDSNNLYRVNRLVACGLALAGAADTTSRLSAENEDGILTGYEASLLNLSQTELVTLSACETGVGDALAGEGVFGLQRAFLLAGAQSVLMSLWKVNDELTQQLMADFYRYWLAGLSKPQALRQAQINLRKQYPNPYFWGAFTLLGQ